MAEDRIQHHLLGRDQLIHIRLGVVIEHRTALRMPHAALRRFDVGLLLGDKERCQAVAQVVEPKPMALFEQHPRLDCSRNEDNRRTACCLRGAFARGSSLRRTSSRSPSSRRSATAKHEDTSPAAAPDMNLVVLPIHVLPFESSDFRVPEPGRSI